MERCRYSSCSVRIQLRILQFAGAISRNIRPRNQVIPLSQQKQYITYGAR